MPISVNSIFGDDCCNLICSARQMTKSWYTTVALDYKTVEVGIEKKKITTLFFYDGSPLLESKLEERESRQTYSSGI